MHIEQMWTLRETPDAKRTDPPTTASEIHDDQDVTVDDEPTKKLRLTLTILSTFKIVLVYLSNVVTNSVEKDVVGGNDEIHDDLLRSVTGHELHVFTTSLQLSLSGISASFPDSMLLYTIHIRNLFVLFIQLWVVCGLELSEVSCIFSPFCRTVHITSFRSLWRNRNLVHHSHEDDSMSVSFWCIFVSLLHYLVVSILDSEHHLIRFATQENLVYEFKNSPSILCAVSSQHARSSKHLSCDLDSWHVPCLHTKNIMWEDVNFCAVHFLTILVIWTTCLAHISFEWFETAHSIWKKLSSAPLWKAFLQGCLSSRVNVKFMIAQLIHGHDITQNATWFKIHLTSINPSSYQHARLVLSSETTKDCWYKDETCRKSCNRRRPDAAWWTERQHRTKLAKL